MKKSFEEALKHRRTYYSITNQSPVSDEEIERIVNLAVTHVPSAFNSQSTRVVLLLGENHKKLWHIVKETLRKIVPPEVFKTTEAKIDNSFASGYGTVLFFEDQSVVKGLQEAFSSYKDNFPGWSLQTSAMHQLAVWTMLEDVGFGASLQHYNPLIDEEVRHTWHLPEEWHLIAEMPFGLPVQGPGDKDFKDLDTRVKGILNKVYLFHRRRGYRFIFGQDLLSSITSLCVQCVMIKSFMKKNDTLIRVRMPVLISPRTRPHGHRHAGRSRSQAIIAKDIKENKMLLTTFILKEGTTSISPSTV